MHPPVPSAVPKPQYTPSQRRDQLRVLLRAGWQPLTAVMERLGISRATAFRRLKELGDTEPLESKEEDRLAYWRLPSSSPRDPSVTLNITTAEMVALAFVRNALGFLAGTGIKEDLDTLLDRFSHALKSSDYAHWKNLDRKLYDLNEGVHDYRDKMDVVNDVVTALLREERITCKLKGGREVRIDPYTLLLYKKGLYVLGFHHGVNEVRKLGLDIIEETTRVAGDTFAYPPDFEPKAALSGPFGMIAGPLEHVVIRFDRRMYRYVTRRMWHATQSFRNVGGEIEMTLDPHGTKEIVSWVMSFGSMAQVLEPAALREEVARELRAAAAKYDCPQSG
jgi:predicted DNA-binding transcriptional regulator YafY